jgi:ActR/RegA family two-component response regulator
LIIDDESSETDRLLHEFSRAGFRTAGVCAEDDRLDDLLVPFVPEAIVVDPTTIAERNKPQDWLVRRLRSRFPAAKIVVQTRIYSLADCFRCAQSGAAAYLSKPTSAAEVLAFLAEQPISQKPLPGTEDSLSLARFEWEHISRVMAACGGNKSRAAEVLRIPRFTLQRKLSRPGHIKSATNCGS